MVVVGDVTCSVCGSVFQGRVNHTGYDPAKRCCSPKCQAARQRPRDRTGRNNPGYKHGESGRAYRYSGAYRKRPENRHKVSAGRVLRTAIKLGRMARGTSCEACGATGRIDAHHPDYAFPLLVRWLCRRCHVAEHRNGG